MRFKLRLLLGRRLPGWLCLPIARLTPPPLRYARFLAKSRRRRGARGDAPG
jgi:hypothetical protein